MRQILILLLLVSSCANSGDSECESPMYDDLFSFPLDATCYYELNQAIKCAKSEYLGLICIILSHTNDPGLRENHDYFLQLIENEKDILKKFNFVLLYMDDRSIADTVNWVFQEDDTLRRIGDLNVHYASNLLTMTNPIWDGSIHALDKEMQPIVPPLTPNSQNYEVEAFIRCLKD